MLKAKNEEMQTMNQQANKKNYTKLIDTFENESKLFWNTFSPSGINYIFKNNEMQVITL